MGLVNKAITMARRQAVSSCNAFAITIFSSFLYYLFILVVVGLNCNANAVDYNVMIRLYVTTNNVVKLLL